MSTNLQENRSQFETTANRKFSLYLEVDNKSPLQRSMDWSDTVMANKIFSSYTKVNSRCYHNKDNSCS